MTVGQRIAFAFSLMLVAGGWLSVAIHQNTERLIADNTWVVHTHAVIELLHTVARSTNRAEAELLGYSVSGDSARLDSYRQARGRTETALAELVTRTHDNAAQQARCARLQQQLVVVYEAFERMLRAEPHATRAAGPHEYRGELDAAREAIGQIIDAERVLLEQRAQSASDAARSTLQAIIWGGAMIVGLCIVLGVVLTLSFVRPVRALMKGAEEIGAGNLQHRTRTGTSDELGVLAEAFNSMAVSLSRTMVTADVERHARARTEALLATIAQTSNRLTSSTAEIVAATNQQATGAQEQAAAVTQTVATINEVVQAAQHARERAQGVAEIARASAVHGQSGRQVVQRSLEAMRSVRGLVERSARGTAELAQTAQAIGGVIANVSDIAEQTHVLALNAALEAAHAGERATTFRVVASEVKVLASQCKDAAKGVQRMLQSVQVATDNLVSVAAECGQSVTEASEVIARADASISALATVIETASLSAAQIAASASQQETGTVQIHHAMEQIREVTVQNLSSTRRMEQAARDLSALGHRLHADLNDANTSGPRSSAAENANCSPIRTAS